MAEASRGFRKKVQEDARYDGKRVLRTTTTLPPQQVALTVRGLWRVESIRQFVG